jgi:hypothetical protein
MVNQLFLQGKIATAEGLIEQGIDEVELYDDVDDTKIATATVSRTTTFSVNNSTGALVNDEPITFTIGSEDVTKDASYIILTTWGEPSYIPLLAVNLLAEVDLTIEGVATIAAGALSIIL